MKKSLIILEWFSALLCIAGGAFVIIGFASFKEEIAFFGIGIWLIGQGLLALPILKR